MLLFTGGKSESGRVEELIGRLALDPAARGRLFNLAGKTSLAGVVKVLQASDLVISVDSGIMHLAAWADVPLIALFGPETPNLFGPRSSRAKVFWSELPCSPCLTNLNAKTSDCRLPVCIRSIEVEEVAREALPSGYSYQWTGLALEEKESGGQSLLLFALGLLVVYLTLSAQYESFVLPFIILLSVPMAILGALGAQWLRGLQNDVYCQVGLVMLIGLASKNAILIVEFAEQLQARGIPLMEAAAAAARLRLRPILMTSVATIMGVMPLVFATGAGSAGRHSVGTTVAGGMIVSTFLNLFIIPVLYVIVRGWLPLREHHANVVPETAD